MGAGTRRISRENESAKGNIETEISVKILFFQADLTDIFMKNGI